MKTATYAYAHKKYLRRRNAERRIILATRMKTKARHRRAATNKQATTEKAGFYPDLSKLKKTV